MYKEFHYYLEAIQLQHLKIIVGLYLHTYCKHTKFERNLKSVSLFCVHLTWNDSTYSCVEVLSLDTNTNAV